MLLLSLISETLESSLEVPMPLNFEHVENLANPSGLHTLCSR